MKRLCFLLLTAALLVGMNSCQSNYDDLTTKDHAALLVGEYNIQANSYYYDNDNPVSGKYYEPLAEFLPTVSVNKNEEGGIDVFINWRGGSEQLKISHNELVNAVKQWTDAIFFDAKYVIEKDGYTIAFGVSNQTIYSSKNISDIMITMRESYEDGYECGFIFYGSREKAIVKHTVAFMADGETVNGKINAYVSNPITKIVFQTSCTTPQPELNEYNNITGDTYYEVTTLPVWIEQVDNILYIRTKAEELFANMYMAYLFDNLEGNCFDSVTEIDFGKNFNTINTLWYDCMFASCYSLDKLDLSCFNTSNAISLKGMFLYCEQLKSLNISSFNTENVKCMGGMFAHCQQLGTLNLSNFKTPKLTNIYFEEIEGYSIFTDCQSLTTLNLSGFETSNIENFERMFENCISLKSLDLSSFDTQSATNMWAMFKNCYKLESIKLGQFDVSHVWKFREMFKDCHALKSLDLSYWKTDICDNICAVEMFKNCYSLKSLTLGKDFLPLPLEISIPHYFSYMFENMGRDADPCNIYYYEDDLKTWILGNFPELGRPTVNFSKMEIIYE